MQINDDGNTIYIKISDSECKEYTAVGGITVAQIDRKKSMDAISETIICSVFGEHVLNSCDDKLMERI
ncbi:MAG: hypothetical protein PHE67_12080 [Campylobacterales bacterium]|nr:hypothetical protein [Campylobacterales bacterium]